MLLLIVCTKIEDKQSEKNIVSTAASEPRSLVDSDMFDDEIADEHNGILSAIGPPWSWMHQFAVQSSPAKSYNFVEKQMIEDSDELNDGEDTLNKSQCYYSCVIEPIPGIGGLISVDTTQQFLSFLKYRSKDENGLVFPRHFHEDNCPNMTDD